MRPYDRPMGDGRDQVRLYVGGSALNYTERSLLRSLRRHLEASGEPAVLMADLTLGPGGRQVDLIAATSTAAVVIEVKGYSAAVRGGKNGGWMIERGQGDWRPLGRTNPYRQANDCRFAVTDALAQQAITDSDRAKDAVGGMLCLFPSVPARSEIPVSDFKISIGGYDELLKLLSAPRLSPIALDDWRRFAVALGLDDATRLAPTEAEAGISDYIGALNDLVQAISEPFIEPQFKDEELSTANLVELVARGGQVQLIGPSGSGKTKLMQRLALAIAGGGNLPILVRARDFESQLTPLLKTWIARCSPASLSTLLRWSKEAGAGIIILVDGMNECPQSLRDGLVGALQAARKRMGARIILAGQEEFPLPRALAGQLIHLLQPDQAQSLKLVEAHLRRTLNASERPAVEIVATAQDAFVLADILNQGALIDGRFALYHSFTRARVSATEPATTFKALSALASSMRDAFVVSVARSAAEHMLSSIEPRAVSSALHAALIVLENGRIAFRHELIGDFFVVDGILEQVRTPTELGRIARLPINAELREFLLGACSTSNQIEALLGTDPDPRLLRSAIAGRAGSKARNFVLSRIRDLIDELRHCYSRISLSLPDDFDRTKGISSLVPRLQNDVREFGVDRGYLSLIPAALDQENIFERLLDLFGAVDRQLEREAHRLREAHSEVRLHWRAAAAGTVYGVHYFSGARDLQNLLQGISNDWGAASQSASLRLGARLNDFEHLRTGQLFLLICAMRRSYREPLPARFPDLLEHVWGLRVYHLFLYICDMIRFRGSELPDDQQNRVRAFLNESLSDSNVWMNTIIIDALQGVDGIEQLLSVDDAVEEYEAMLRLPETAESRSLAVSGITRTYDHPYQDTYWEAFYDVLPVETRHGLLLRALRDDAGDPWFIDDVLRALRKEPTRKATPDLQRLALGPKLSGHSRQHS